MNVACWRRGLTHQPFTLAFTGSNPVHVIFIRAFSSAGRASALQAGCRRFDPVNSHFFYAGVAQLAEQLICNQQVAGSSPITGLQRRQLLTRLSFLFRNSPFYSGTYNRSAPYSRVPVSHITILSRSEKSGFFALFMQDNCCLYKKKDFYFGV